MSVMSLVQWPAAWSRARRSTATMIVGGVAMLLMLWLMAIPLSWAPDPIGNNAAAFAEGTRMTVLLTLIAGVAGIVMGVLAALGKLSKFPALRWIASGYIWVMRGTPLLVQVLFVYFALPEMVPFLKIDAFPSACIALAFNAGAYNAEAIRAGLLAIPRGQVEAARSLGLSPWHTFIDVTLPQAFKVALPPLVSNLIALLKDSSLAYSIGVVELTNIGNQIQARTFLPTATLTTVALTYLALTTISTQISNAVERRFDVEGRLQ